MIYENAYIQNYKGKEQVNIIADGAPYIRYRVLLLYYNRMILQ